MQYSKRHMGAAAVALLLAGGAAQSGDVSIPSLPDTGPGHDKLVVGIGIICNTGEQAEHYVSLRADGAQLLPAVNAVNDRAHEPRACGMAAIAFRRDKTIDTQRLNGKLVSIVRISVMAGYDGQRWARVPAMVQYAVLEAEGLEI